MKAAYVFLMLLLATAYADDDKIPCTAQCFTGLMVMFILIFFTMIGVNMLNNISGPVNFTVQPLLIGKEK